MLVVLASTHRKFMCVTTKKKTYVTLNGSTVGVMEVETKNPVEVF